MALKFLNKKGWHTGSLRNIENVWKAEQKHDSEQKKLEELRKQIQEERERSEFRLLQEQAGLVPKQERLDFLYDSGLAVGKGSSSDGFKALEALPKKTETTDTSSSSNQQASVPGALFEEKPQSANDTWRKLHSDPLLLIRQREQEALTRIKNNPIQMSMIRKSVEANKKHERKENKKHHHHQKNSNRDKLLSSKGQSNSENPAEEGEERRKWSHHKNSRHEEHSSKGQSASEVTARTGREGRSYQKNLKREDHSSKRQSESEAATSDEEERRQCSHHRSKKKKHLLDSEAAREREYKRSYHRDSDPQIWRSETNSASTDTPTATLGHRKHRPTASKLSEEERAARLREMQMDAKLHEEQRWKRLKKASENDAQEASQAGSSGGRNFLNAAQKSIYGTEKGGSSTIEESVRRRTYYLQGQSEAGQGNAFRR